MQVFTSVIAHGNSSNFLAASFDEIRTWFGLFSLTGNNFLCERNISSFLADCWDYLPDIERVLCLGWQTGTITLFDALSGEQVNQFRSNGAQNARFAADGSIRVLARKDLHIYQQSGTICSSTRIKEQILADCGEFILVKTGKRYGVLDCENRLRDSKIPMTGYGITAMSYDNAVLVLGESVGQVHKICLSDPTRSWSIKPPDGYSPIHVGYHSRKDLVFVLFAKLETLTQSRLEIYGADRRCIFTQNCDICPPIACFSQYVTGFIAGTMTVIKANLSTGNLETFSLGAC